MSSRSAQRPRWILWWEKSDKAEVSTRVGIAVAAGVLLLLLCQTWHPPFAYRLGAIPARDLISRVTFEVPNETETKALQDRKRREQLAFYRNRPQPMDELRAALRNKVFPIFTSPSFDQLSEEGRIAFAEFFDGDETDPDDTPVKRFSMLKTVLADDPELKKLDEAIEIAMRDNYKNGLINQLQHSIDQGSQERVRVYPVGRPDEVEFVEISDVLIAQAGVAMTKRLREQFRTKFPAEDSQKVAAMISDWIVERLPKYETLQYDDEMSEEARVKAAAAVEPVMTVYRYGDSKPLAEAGKVLSEKEVRLLSREWIELISRMRWVDKFARMVAYGGMIAALYLLCASYIWFVDDRRLLLNKFRLARLLGTMVVAIGLAYWVSGDRWRGELVPLVMASILTGVVYGRELALLLMAAACVSTTLFLGTDLAELVTVSAACTSCILLLGRIRTRTHLLAVGLTSAVITVLTVVGVGIVTGQTLSAGAPGAGIEPLYRGPQFDMVVLGLIQEALWAGFCILVSAAAMTPLLPLVEKGFGVQTDLSLLELGDASHPLLRRLAQRAPGTYNHSINVASIAEAAADAIGANGLLVRVGDVLPRHRQDVQAGILHRKPIRRRQPTRFVAAGHVDAGHHRTRQGWCRLGAKPSLARADHRLHLATPRHDVG